MEMMDIIESGGLKSRMIDETMRQGSMLMNQSSTRNEKELFMSKLYNRNLPPQRTILENSAKGNADINIDTRQTNYYS